MVERLKSCWISKKSGAAGCWDGLRTLGLSKVPWCTCGIYCLEGGTKQIPHLLEMVLLVVCSLRKIDIKIIPIENHKMVNI